MRRTILINVGNVLVMGVIGVAIFFGLMYTVSNDLWSCEKDYEPWETELYNVGISVEYFMRDPGVPVHDLMTDSRVACGEGGCVMCDEDPTVDECTNDINKLITLSGNPGEGDNEVWPLGEYLPRDIQENYYCVHPDGAVEGFFEDGTRIGISEALVPLTDYAEDQLKRVSSAVKDFMSDLDPPVKNLMTDPRLACSEGGCVMCDSDPVPEECTRKILELIILSGTTNEDNRALRYKYRYNHNAPIYVSDAYYYCVHPDGTVEGFLWDGRNIRDL